MTGPSSTAQSWRVARREESLLSACHLAAESRGHRFSTKEDRHILRVTNTSEITIIHDSAPTIVVIRKSSFSEDVLQ